jgi:cobalt/nickel transport system permease protein
LHVHFLDPYQPRESPLHRLDPRIKFVLAIGFILTVALIPVGSWPVYILAFSVAISAAILSGLGLGYVLRRAVIALPFVLGAFPVIFTTPGPSLFSITLGSWQLAASGAGVERFASVALKSWISVQAAILLAASTPFPDLLVAMRAVRIPRLLVAIFGLMWRYLFVLADEALRLMRARAARSGVSEGSAVRPGGGFPWRARVAGGMAGNLFVRSIERSDRIYQAMLSRGYDGEVRTLPLPGLKHTDWLILAAGLSLFALLLISSLLFAI